MPIPTDPYDFTAGDTASAEEVDARFAVLYDLLAGGLDDENMVQANRLAPVLEKWRPVHRSHLLFAGVGTSGLHLPVHGALALDFDFFFDQPPVDFFRLAPAEMEITGLDLEFRLTMAWLVNGTAPGCTFEAALIEADDPGGGADNFTFDTADAAVIGGTVHSGTLAAGASGSGVGSEFPITTAKNYMLGVVKNSAAVANTVVQLEVELQARYV